MLLKFIFIVFIFVFGDIVLRSSWRTWCWIKTATSRSQTLAYARKASQTLLRWRPSVALRSTWPLRYGTPELLASPHTLCLHNTQCLGVIFWMYVHSKMNPLTGKAQCAHNCLSLFPRSGEIPAGQTHSLRPVRHTAMHTAMQTGTSQSSQPCPFLEIHVQEGAEPKYCDVPVCIALNNVCKSCLIVEIPGVRPVKS